MCERLYPVWVKCEVVEIRNLLIIPRSTNVIDIAQNVVLTSSRCLTSSLCLLAICFSTNEVALNSFWHVLHLNLPSSSCLMNCSHALVSSLVKNKHVF